MSDRTTISIGVRTSVGRALVEFMDFFFFIFNFMALPIILIKFFKKQHHIHFRNEYAYLPTVSYKSPYLVWKW